MAFIVALKKKNAGKGEDGAFDEMEALKSDARMPLPTKEDSTFVMEVTYACALGCIWARGMHA